jgi:hypothetical protein
VTSLLLALLLALPIDEPRHSPYSEECLFVVATIIQHESGSLRDHAAWEFMADQITYDIGRIGCHSLTQWRWAIKSRPRPIPAVIAAAHHWPRTYPRCQFIGMPPDIKVWKAAGYRIRVDYTFTSGRLTIVGANCGK